MSAGLVCSISKVSSKRLLGAWYPGQPWACGKGTGFRAYGLELARAPGADKGQAPRRRHGQVLSGVRVTAVCAQQKERSERLEKILDWSLGRWSGGE